MKNYISTAETAYRLKCTDRNVRYLIENKKLRAEKISGVYLVEEQSLREYQKKAGR